MRKLLLATILTAFLTQPAHATKVAAGILPGGCVMVETISLGINFNIMAATLMEAKAKFDEKMQQISNFAKKMEIDKFEPQSMNYNIYSQQNNNMSSYQLNGSAQYQLKSADVAFKFAEFLEKEKFTVNVNSNSYRQGNCAN